MSSFTQFSAELHTVKASDTTGYLDGDYRFIDPGFEFYLSEANPAEKVIIPRGYLSDGASIPWFIRWALKPWGTYGQCAVVHDKLCETWATNLRKIETRKELDEIFFKSMEVAEVPKVIRKGLIEPAINFYRWYANPTKPSTDLYKKGYEEDYIRSHPE